MSNMSSISLNTCRRGRIGSIASTIFRLYLARYFVTLIYFRLPYHPLRIPRGNRTGLGIADSKEASGKQRSEDRV